MNELEKVIGNDGLRLRKIPSKERTAQMCMKAVKQNPRAIKYVPYKLQSPTLCKIALDMEPSVFAMIKHKARSDQVCYYALRKDGMNLQYIDYFDITEQQCQIAVNSAIEALRFVPRRIINSVVPKATKEIIDRCLEWIKRDISASFHLPEIIKCSSRILQFQKQLGYLSFIESYYQADLHTFQVKVEFEAYDQSGKTQSYVTTASFNSFEDYYAFLDGDLRGAYLRDFEFTGIDLRKYNINGAVIHSDVLAAQGLYDDSYYVARFGYADGLLPKENSLSSDESLQYLYLYPAIRQKDLWGDAIEDLCLYYISDIHLCHRVFHWLKCRGTEAEAHAYVRIIVRHMVSSITEDLSSPSYLLIAGDTSSSFEYTDVFFSELVKLWEPSRIVVISGNHELLDPYTDMEENIRSYRAYFDRLGINFLQNDLLCIRETIDLSKHRLYSVKPTVRKLSEKEILTMSEKELCETVCPYSLLILGGIGFSGLNERFNSTNLRYGYSFENSTHTEARKKEIVESRAFETLHRKVADSHTGNSVIVLSHMAKNNWTRDPYIPNWIYISGHDHQNNSFIEKQARIYADNQIGYCCERISLKKFYSRSDYDTLAFYDDGIYVISDEQYSEFCRGKNIRMVLSTVHPSIIMLKRNGYYMFLYYGRYSQISKNERLYLLDGGRLRKLPESTKEAVDRYYDSLELYSSQVQRLLIRYTGAQTTISQFIKRLGGSGKIHGCIIDVDMPTPQFGYSFTNIYLDPVDGTVTPYYAEDIKSRTVFKDLQSMLENRPECKKLLDSFRKLKAYDTENLPAFRYGSSIVQLQDNTFRFEEGDYLYKYSRIIKSLQYCTEKNVIRTWNEVLLNHGFVEQVMVSNEVDIVMNDELIALGD